MLAYSKEKWFKSYLKPETSKKDSLVNKQFACLLDDNYPDKVLNA